MIDMEKIESKYDLIERNLRELRGFDGDFEDFWVQQGVKYSLQEVIEACLDISNHIISVEGFERPEEYSEHFRVLAEEGVIDSELSQRLEDMAKFRNILVHRYQEVENDRLLRFLKDDLEDIERFMVQVNEWLEE